LAFVFKPKVSFIHLHMHVRVVGILPCYLWIKNPYQLFICWNFTYWSALLFKPIGI